MRAALVVAITILVGCDPGVQIGARCALNSDCPESLACRQGRCRIACREARDCGPGLRCIASPDGPACTVAEEENCAGACTGMLACVARQCRSTCTGAADCVTDNCVGGFCEEPMSGVDASVPEIDAGVDGDGGATACGELVLCGDGIVQGCDREERGDLLRALTGTALGEMHYLAPIEIPATATPMEGGSALPPQLALALSATDDAGFGAVAWIGGATRTPFVYRFSLLDLTQGAMHAIPPDVSTLRSLALGEDGDGVYAFFLREAPAAPGTIAWLFRLDDEDPAERITDLGTGPVVQPGRGRVAFVGGDQTMLGTTLPLYATNREEPAGGPVLSEVDGRSAPMGSYRSITSEPFSAAPYLETIGAPGRLLLAWNGTSIAIWNLARETSSLETVVIAPTDHAVAGRPSIAPHTMDGIESMLAVPFERDTRFYRIECSDSDVCTAAAPIDSTSRVTSTTGITPTHVALARVVSGYAYGAIEPISSDPDAPTLMQLRFVDAAGRDVRIFDDGTMPPATFPAGVLTADERMVDVQVAATRNSLGIAVFVALLIRNERTREDRVWIGGLRACFAI